MGSYSFLQCRHWLGTSSLTGQHGTELDQGGQAISPWGTGLHSWNLAVWQSEVLSPQ